MSANVPPDIVWTDAGFRRLEDCAPEWQRISWHDGHYHSVRQTWVCEDVPYGGGKYGGGDVLAGNGTLYAPESLGSLASGQSIPASSAVLQSLGQQTPLSRSLPDSMPVFFGGGSGGGGFQVASGTPAIIPGGSGGTSTVVDSGAGPGDSSGTLTGSNGLPQNDLPSDFAPVPLGTSGLSLVVALSFLVAMRARRIVDAVAARLTPASGA